MGKKFKIRGKKIIKSTYLSCCSYNLFFFYGVWRGLYPYKLYYHTNSCNNAVTQCQVDGSQSSLGNLKSETHTHSKVDYNARTACRNSSGVKLDLGLDQDQQCKIKHKTNRKVHPDG